MWLVRCRCDAEDTRRTLEVRVRTDVRRARAGVRGASSRGARGVRSGRGGTYGAAASCSQSTKLLKRLSKNMMKMVSSFCGGWASLFSARACAMTAPMPRVRACASRGWVRGG